jgi:phage tail-like protein
VPANDNDPYAAFRYAVEIDQLVVGGFSEVSGLSFEAEVETFREGGFDGPERQLPGARKSTGRLVLKRGLGDARELWDWFRIVAAGQMKRRNLAVLLLDADLHELRRWTFTRACPVKWSGPDLRAKASEVAAEALEFVHEGLSP